MSTTIQLRIFSPRWGHEDTYSIELSRESMDITMQARGARATWHENHDPTWSGDSILDIMRNDSIYAPAVTQRMFEHVWTEWRSGGLSDDGAKDAFQELAEWVNVITHAKPRSEFWRQYF